MCEYKMKSLGYFFLILLMFVFAISNFLNGEYIIAIIETVIGIGNSIIFFKGEIDNE